MYMQKRLKLKSRYCCRGNANKPYFVIVYNEVGNDYNNEGFGSYDLSNVFKWRDECLEIVSGEE